MKNPCFETAVPKVETLLEAAHRNYELIHKRKKVFVRSGIPIDHLPEDTALMAFSLLGDHDRETIEGELAGCWQELLSKGLVRGSITKVPTAELRLLAHARPFTDAFDDVWQRLKTATQVADATPEIFRCAKRIDGLWGQEVRLYFDAYEVDQMLIIPDEVFALQSAMVVADTTGKLAGSFTFPLDDGIVTFKLMHRTGEIFRHDIQSRVKGVGF
jgi:hypothetical protein